MSEDKLKLSASRIKLFLDCSWKYYCRYILKLPDQGNSGSRRGGVVHSVFEHLLKEKHRKHYDEIIKSGTTTSSKVISRYIRMLCLREGLSAFSEKGEDNLKMIDEMIVVGLNADFFCEGKKLDVGELEIVINALNYSVIGYIDKLATNKDKTISIYDYKSSKGVDHHDIQALTYALWAKRVMLTDSASRFIYLRKPDGVLYADYKYSDEQLDGFEMFLAELYAYLQDFTEEKARNGLAADKGYPTKEEGFCKKLMCGMGKTQGQLKKDGTVMYACSARWPFSYYVSLKDGKITRSEFEPFEPNEGEVIERREYKGCPAFNVS